MNALKKPDVAKRLSILIADDEPDAVTTLAALLSDEGHVVHTVQRGDHVAMALSRYEPEVCILDIEMPGRSGFELAGEISGMGANRPHLIAISGKYVGEADQTVARAVGFDRFFLKPPDPRELLDLVEQIASGHVVPAPPPVSPAESRQPGRLRVLIADDNRDMVATTSALLRDEGYEVIEANNGRDAVVAVADFDPDVVIADIAMPGLSGWELARAVRRLTGYGRPVLIAISGQYRGSSDRVLTDMSGFDHFVPKPFDMRDVLPLLEPALRWTLKGKSNDETPTPSPAIPGGLSTAPTMTINVTSNGAWVGGPWLWVSVGPLSPAPEGGKVSAPPREAILLATKVEHLLREPFLADVKSLGYKRAIERLEFAVAAIRAREPTAVSIVIEKAGDQRRGR